MLSNNHIFVDKVEGDKVEGGFVTVPSPTPGVGKQQLLPKLADSLKDLPFLMCGPPGTGKHNLLKVATEKANLKMNTYDLGHISNDFRVRHRDLETMLNRYGGKLQTNLMGVRSLLVLQGGEHLDTEAARLVRKYDVVILANERTAPLKAVFGDRTVWVNRLTKDELRCSLQTLHPKSAIDRINAAVQVADGDLRKALRELQFGGSKVDKASHVYFDVQDALCNGARKELNHPCRAWVLENHTQVNKSMEEHATFSENLLAAELIAACDHNACEADWSEAKSMADCIAGLATRKLVGHKRAHFTLNSAPDQSRFPINPVKPPSKDLCQESLQSYFTENVSTNFPWMPSKARNKCTHATHGNGAAVNEETTTATASNVNDGARTPPPRKRARPTVPEAEAVNAQNTANPAPSDQEEPDLGQAAASSAVPSNVILKLKGVNVISTQPFASTNREESKVMACGPAIESTRMRSEVIVMCPDTGEDVPRALKAAYRELKQEGVTGLVVSKFYNCVAAFILKDKTKELKINGVAKALGQTTPMAT